MKTILIRSLVLMAGLFATQSSFASTLVWDWTYTSADYNGSGTFMTASGTSDYLVTDVTGLWNGDEITGIAARGTFGGNDNLIDDTQPQLDFSGLAFATTTGEYNMFYSGSQYEVCLTAGCTGGVGPGTFSAISAVSPGSSIAAETISRMRVYRRCSSLPSTASKRE